MHESKQPKIDTLKLQEVRKVKLLFPSLFIYFYETVTYCPKTLPPQNHPDGHPSAKTRKIKSNIDHDQRPIEHTNIFKDRQNKDIHTTSLHVKLFKSLCLSVASLEFQYLHKRNIRKSLPVIHFHKINNSHC